MATLVSMLLMLKQGALSLFHSLPAPSKSTMYNVNTAFKGRYSDQPRNKWKRTTQLRQLKQETGQSVAYFITKAELIAKKVTADET